MICVTQFISCVCESYQLLAMEVKVVSRKLVKPLTPTPENLKNYKISFMDELNPTMNVVGILYYNHATTATNAKLQQLEESLSEILPSFYPFAGRYIKQDRRVDCNDSGALLIEADVDLELAQITNPDSGIMAEELNDLLPCEIGAADEETDPILLIQVNRFKCGGLAISICISHRVVDACSLGTFISGWTNAAQGCNRAAICPSFDGPISFPGRDFPAPEFGTTRARENSLCRIICKRLIFDGSAISGLKQRAGKASDLSRPPSRVGVVSGLVVKAIAGIRRAKSLVVAQAVNIRERTVPPLSKHSCGNLVALAITQCSDVDTKEMGLGDFVRLLGDDARNTVRGCAGLLSGEGHRSWIETSVELSEKSLSKDVNVVWVTDWSKFGFYEADFGWGKPVWASVANVVVKNHVLLMSNKEGDGIEAWVQLEESDMTYFEKEINTLISA